MALLRRRTNSTSTNGVDESDNEEEHKLLEDDYVDASKYKIPVLRQQFILRGGQRGGGCAKICLLMSILGVVILTSIAISLKSNSLYCGLLYAEDDERKKMVDGLAGAVVIYAITGSFSLLILWIRRPHITSKVQWQDEDERE